MSAFPISQHSSIISLPTNKSEHCKITLKGSDLKKKDKRAFIKAFHPEKKTHCSD